MGMGLGQEVTVGVLIDGMFLISHLSMGKPQDHVRLCQLPLKTAHSTTLCLRGKGSTPLFDHPGRHPNSPKVFERARRSAQAESTHTCINFNEATPIPRRWQENILTCYQCEREVVSFLATYLANNVSKSSRTTQPFVTAGGFEGSLQDEALMVQLHSLPRTDPMLCCNAEEADTRIWLHVAHSAKTNKLVVSPDTDVYHIGLPIIAKHKMNVKVQLSRFNTFWRYAEFITSGLGHTPNW